jgi:Transposase DDE domain
MSRQQYCQYLVVTHINYTMTYLATHKLAHNKQVWSHDTIRNFLLSDKVTPSALWHQVEKDIVQSPRGFIIFDDSVMDKNYSMNIELVRRQYSGNTKSIIRGIGVVACVYVNPDTDQYWVIDYRIYDPDGDGLTKIEHLQAMLAHCVEHKNLSFFAVLMDSWYAVTAVFKQIEALTKYYYCPIKRNRLVNDSGGQMPHTNVEKLLWNQDEQEYGKIIHLKTMPKGHRMKLFRLVLSSERTEYIVTNDMIQHNASAIKTIVSIRWNIEQVFRETKQLTGIERCQARKERIQRNHIGCALMVWGFLKKTAYQTQQTIYRIKHGLLDAYIQQQLAQPTILFS